MRVSWMRELSIGQKCRNLLSQRDFVIVALDWGKQSVTLRTKFDDLVVCRLEKFYEYYS